MEERVGSVKEGEVKLNECRKGRKRGAGRYWERCRYREAVTRTYAALLTCERPAPLPSPTPRSPPLCQHLSSNPASPSPPPLPFSLLPSEPDRQTLRDCGIITLFLRRLKLLPELTCLCDPPTPVPFHRDHRGPGDGHRCRWSHVWKQRKAHLFHPAGGALLLCGAKDGYHWQIQELLV